MIDHFQLSLLPMRCNCMFHNRANNENALLSAPVITRPLMTPTQPSRKTLADLIPLIEKANLSPIQQRDQISAVRTRAGLLDTPAGGHRGQSGQTPTPYGDDRVGS
jgi:hypothetical protein